MVDVWCGGCPVWWMSGVVDVCVVDVVQSQTFTLEYNKMLFLNQYVTGDFGWMCGWQVFIGTAEQR